MSVLLGLVSLGGLSLFLARMLRRSSALMPLLSVALAMVWITVFGCVGLLWLGAWLWYALCLLAVLAVILMERRNLLALCTPGFLFFMLGGLFFALLFWVTNPMFVEWDAFTFWGTAGKAMFEQGELFTTAQSNLLHRSYPPGLLSFSYLIQFFSKNFSEASMLAAYSFVYLASFSAAGAFWKKQKAVGTVFLCGLFLLPFFLEPGTVQGDPSWVYRTVMADLPMAAMFGGILGYAFSDEQKDARFFLPFGVLLAALTNVKDMGFALALLALLIMGADLFFCERNTLSFFRFKKTGAWVLACLVCAAMIVGMYLLWAVHLAMIPSGVDRFNLGSAGQQLSMGTLLLQALGALLGLQYHEQYSQVLPLMLEAFYSRPISLLGSGAVVFMIIVGVLGLAYFLAVEKKQRRRILVFFVVSALGFLLYYLFHLMLYAFIFKPVEALILKDYLRYLTPYWQGWLTASLVLLGISGMSTKRFNKRTEIAKAASMGFVFCLLAVLVLQAHPGANFLFISPSNYGERLDVQDVLASAQEQGMQEEDRVYVLSQGDDGTRSYQYRYELDADMALQYAGVLRDENGETVQENGEAVYVGNVGGTLVDSLDTTPPAIAYPFEADSEDFVAFLRQEQVSHVLIDRIDNYFLSDFQHLFSDELAAWSDDASLSTGHRYYRVEEGDTGLLLVPQEGGEVA